MIDQEPYCDLVPNRCTEACWVWLAVDASESGKAESVTFGLKFVSKELAMQFKLAFDSAKVSASLTR